MAYDFLWTAAPEIKVRLLALAIAAQACLAVWTYTKMSKARFKAAKAGEVQADIYKATQNEPEDLAVYTRTVANQFEMPVLFYAGIIGGIALGSSSWITVVFAFVYVFLRQRHAAEMVGGNIVLKRRKTFIRSAQVFLALLAEFVISAMLFAQA